MYVCTMWTEGKIYSEYEIILQSWTGRVFPPCPTSPSRCCPASSTSSSSATPPARRGRRRGSATRPSSAGTAAAIIPVHVLLASGSAVSVCIISVKFTGPKVNLSKCSDKPCWFGYANCSLLSVRSRGAGDERMMGERVTYFSNAEWPGPGSQLQLATHSIRSPDPDICQVRLDLLTFSLAPPSLTHFPIGNITSNVSKSFV